MLCIGYNQIVREEYSKIQIDLDFSHICLCRRALCSDSQNVSREYIKNISGFERSPLNYFIQFDWAWSDITSHNVQNKNRCGFDYVVVRGWPLRDYVQHVLKISHNVWVVPQQSNRNRTTLNT